MKTIDHNSLDIALTMTAALRLLGIQINPNTATEYRKWLGLMEGEYFDRTAILRLHAMWWWCSQGSGRSFFSKRKFIELEQTTLANGRSQIDLELERRGYVKPTSI